MSKPIDGSSKSDEVVFPTITQAGTPVRTEAEQTTHTVATGVFRETPSESGSSEINAGTAPSDARRVNEATTSVLNPPPPSENKEPMTPQQGLQQIKESTQQCLQNLDSVNSEAVNKFAETLKSIGETFKGQDEVTIGDKKLHGKNAEQEFVVQAMKSIVKQTKIEAKKIMADPSLSPDQKAEKLQNLALMSQSLLALASVQHRFGGRLAFHCLPHSLGVAEGSAQFYKGTKHEFAAFCAGANHDTVMDYQGPPLRAKNDPSAKAFQESFMSKLKEKQANNPESKPLHMLMGSDIPFMKGVKRDSEQKRNAGFKDGNSEKESYKQLEAQLQELHKVIGNTVRTDAAGRGEQAQEEAEEVLGKMGKGLSEAYPFMEKSIEGTIPLLHGFAPPTMGTKLMSIFNANVAMTPVELANANNPRMLAVMDRVAERVNPEGPTYSQAVKDIKENQAYYKSLADKVVAFEKEKGGRVTNEEFAEIKAKHKEEHTPLPRFFIFAPIEGRDQIFFMPSLFPTYDDPAKSWTMPPEEIAKIFKEELVKDAEEHGNNDLIDELIQRASTVGTAATDLGAMMDPKASVEEESVGLIAEEQDYDARAFIALQQSFTSPERPLSKEFPNGMRDEKFHEAMQDETRRKELGVTDEEYGDMMRFLSIGYYFNNDQRPFCEGRRAITQHYIYQPMLAVSQAAAERGVQSDAVTLNRTLENFEEKYVHSGDQGKALNDNFDQLAELAEKSKMPGSLSSMLLDELEKRFGNFVDAGYTAVDRVDENFLAEQKKPLIDSRIWA